MDQLVKRLPCKYKGLNSDTRCPQKNPGPAVHSCDANMGGTDWLAELGESVCASCKTRLKKQTNKNTKTKQKIKIPKWRTTGKDTRHQFEASIPTHEHVNTCEHTWTYTYTRRYMYMNTYTQILKKNQRETNACCLLICKVHKWKLV